jgi:predicted nuclease of predicted toxin-antitoxin system
MNISPLTVRALVEAGWEAQRVSGPLSDDSSDEDILVYAAKTDRVVCTQDLDFSDLLAVSGRDWPSVITLRLSDAAPEVVTDRLLDVLPLVADDLKSGAIVTVDDDTVRVRSLPIGE